MKKSDVDAPRPEHSPTSSPREHSIERLLSLLESATEGSDDLDDAIMEAVADSPLHMTYLGKYGWRFSRSLDAALTLVRPEDFWRVGHDGEGPDPAEFLALVMPATSPTQHACHTSPAIALCIAALRARAAS